MHDPLPANMLDELPGLPDSETAPPDDTFAREEETSDAPAANDSVATSPSFASDAGWHWHDAALIVFERADDADRPEYAVGAVDLYANAYTGDLGGSYLEIGAFDDLDRAASLYRDLQADADARMLLPFQFTDYLNEQAQQRGQLPEWRAAGPIEYAAYEAIRSLDAPDLLGDVQPADPVQQFQDVFADETTRLLEPVDPVVNYSFDVVDADPWTMELRASKWWFGGDGTLHHDGLIVNAYSMESYEFERESEREIAAMDREDLERTHRQEGLEASMRKVEAMAAANHDLDPMREDGRLFSDGPPDRFTTLREAQLSGQEPSAAVHDRDEWQELLDRSNNDAPDSERHYWQMHYRLVETPGGEPLGTALFVTEFPNVPPDFAEYVEKYGMDDTNAPTRARTLEMAHFASEDDARKFEAEFRSYLVPDLLDGPGLAPEVAKLEGLSGEWGEMDYQAVTDYMSGKRTIIRERDNWHLYDPQAERKAQESLNAHRVDIDF